MTSEPVAWLYRHHEFDDELEYARWGGCSSDNYVGWTETPLYAHTPTTLTDAEIVEMLARALRDADDATDDWLEPEELAHVALTTLRNADLIGDAR